MGDCKVGERENFGKVMQMGKLVRLTNQLENGPNPTSKLDSSSNLLSNRKDKMSALKQWPKTIAVDFHPPNNMEEKSGWARKDQEGLKIRFMS